MAVAELGANRERSRPRTLEGGGKPRERTPSRINGRQKTPVRVRWLGQDRSAQEWLQSASPVLLDDSFIFVKYFGISETIVSRDGRSAARSHEPSYSCHSKTSAWHNEVVWVVQHPRLDNDQPVALCNPDAHPGACADQLVTGYDTRGCRVSEGGVSTAGRLTPAGLDSLASASRPGLH